ncbi:MAG: glycosyltransferase family 1 protein [Sphingomicrobium sp.]
MRIALFSGNYNYLREGANQALNRLVSDLQARGHEFRVYSPVTDTPAFEPAGTLVPVPSVQLPKRSEFRLALGINRALRDDIRTFRPDLVQVSTPDILGTRAQTFAKRLGVPVVASLHTRFETYLGYYGLNWLRPLVEAHLNRFYRRSDMVLAPNRAVQVELARICGAERVAVWGRGIDPDRFSPTRRSASWRSANGWSADDIVLLFFGRLVVEKGVQDYIETVRQLRSSGLPVKALVIGEGPARDRFSALPDAVLTGHLDGDALGQAVASADIMLSPSVTEAFGNVIVECMASGLAVVSADAQSSRELIDPGVTGLLCDPSRPNDYVTAIAGLIADPGRRQAMAIAAIAESGRHSWEDASLNVERAYRTVISRGPRPRP